MRRRRLTIASLAGVTVSAAAWLLCASMAIASMLPDPEALRQVLNVAPRVVEVIEPHLTHGHETRAKYWAGPRSWFWIICSVRHGEHPEPK